MKFKIFLLLTLTLAGLCGYGQLSVNNKKETVSSNWKIYTNDSLGFTFKYPITWSKNGEESNAINLKGTVMSVMINLIDTVTHSILYIKYHLAPYGADLFKTAQVQLDSSRGWYPNSAKLIDIAGNKAIESFSIMSSDIKGNIYNPPLKFVHIIFLDKQQTGAFTLQFKTLLPDSETEIVKLNQLLSTFRFLN